jgi:tetratricopeptide (TPR) repeat protein
LITEEAMDELLNKTRDSIGNRPADEIILLADGFGALEVMRRTHQEKDNPFSHLYFGKTDALQSDWVSLLKKGYLPQQPLEEKPRSWMLQAEWIDMLKQSVKGPDRYNSHAHLQLGMYYLYVADLIKARESLSRSMELLPSCWALYALGIIEGHSGNSPAGTQLIRRAAELNANDLSLARAAMKALLGAKNYNEALEFALGLDPELQNDGRINLYTAFAHAYLRELEEAESILFNNGGLVVADIKEGETSITELWFAIEELRCQKDGKPFNRSNLIPPAEFDYATNVVRN